MNMLIENSKTRSEVLFEQISSLNYGDVISHQSIDKIIGVPYGSQKYNAIIQKTKRLLSSKTGKILENIRKEGYRIVTPDDYVDQSLKHYKRGFKEIEKGTKTLSYAPVADMSEEGRSIYRRVNDRAAMLHASMKGTMVELKTLGKKNHPFLPENMKR